MLLFFLRTPLMDNWYSLSYLYFSTVGTLVTLFVGMLISVSTGNINIAIFSISIAIFIIAIFTSVLIFTISVL